MKKQISIEEIIIGDADEHLACMAPRYLASHGVSEFAPDIIESFKQGKNNVPSNCAMALGDLLYVPALDDILERLSNVESLNTFWGILYYLGKIRQDDCRQVLIKLLDESADNNFVEMVAYHLLEHGNSQDIPKVLAKLGRDNLAAIISSYFSIIEREGYFEVLDSGDFSVGSLIDILQNASKKFPEILLNRLVDLSPINELKSALSDELATWGDIDSGYNPQTKFFLLTVWNFVKTERD